MLCQVVVVLDDLSAVKNLKVQGSAVYQGNFLKCSLLELSEVGQEYLLVYSAL